MIAVSPLASGQFSYVAGTSGTVTVPAATRVSAISCVSAAGGSLTIAPGGPGQKAPVTAGATITLPASGSFTREWPSGGPLGPGTQIVFTSTDAYYVEFTTLEPG